MTEVLRPGRAVVQGRVGAEFGDPVEIACAGERGDTDDPEDGVIIHLPAGTETVERHSQSKSHEPFPLYAVPGTTKPDPLHWSQVAEAADYAEGDAERARLVTKLIDEIGEIPDVRWKYDLQLGGYSRAFHNPVEDRGKALLLSIPESTVFGDGCITLVSGTREQIAEHRYDELEFDVEC